VRLWDERLRQQIYLGDDDFVARMQALAEPQNVAAVDVPRQQRQARKTFAQCLADCGGQRDAALALAFGQHGLAMTALARAVGLSVSRVSRIIGQQEEDARR
jgi:putative transposase